MEDVEPEWNINEGKKWNKYQPGDNHNPTFGPVWAANKPGWWTEAEDSARVEYDVKPWDGAKQPLPPGFNFIPGKVSKVGRSCPKGKVARILARHNMWVHKHRITTELLEKVYDYTMEE
jgi:hypothetical protein